MIGAVVAGLGERLQDESARATLAGVARLFHDPQVLGPIATRLLSLALTDEGRTACAQLIADARVAGAYALYGARTKIAADQHARIAFVMTMKSLGDSALPVVRAALERIHDEAVSGQHSGATALAEDLLLAVPAAHDEVSGHLVVKYAASSIPNLCRAAARALPRVWADRSVPILLQLVEHGDDGVRIAAIVGLRELGAVDANAVTRIAALVEGGHVRSPQLRSAINAALQVASQSASDEADELLVRLATMH